MASVDEADYIFQLVALHKYLAFCYRCVSANNPLVPLFHDYFSNEVAATVSRINHHDDMLVLIRADVSIIPVVEID